MDFLSHCSRISEIVIAVVACGDRLGETLTMLKSALIFTEWWQPLRFVIFSDNLLMPSFYEKVSDQNQEEVESFSFIGVSYFLVLPFFNNLNCSLQNGNH